MLGFKQKIDTESDSIDFRSQFDPARLYQKLLQPSQFGTMDMSKSTGSATIVHQYYPEALKSPRISEKLVTRINKEIQLLKDGLPCSITNAFFIKQDS